MNDETVLIQVTVPASADHIDIVKQTLNGVAELLGFSAKEIDDMKLAVAEACNNAVLHAYEKQKDGQIKIQFQMVPGGMEITVKDEGKSFDPDKVFSDVDALHDKQLEEVRIGGLGIYLMKQLMDEVQLQTDHGTEVIMTKFLGSARKHASNQEPAAFDLQTSEEGNR